MLWRIELFGGLRAYSGDQAITRFQTYKTGALLARLAYPPQHPHAREELTNLLWPDADPASARNRLSQALVWLRPRLEKPEMANREVLSADRQTVGLNPEYIVTDVAQFEEAIQAAAIPHIPPQEQREALRRAVDLYRGELLTGYYEDWVLTERQRLAGAYLAAMRRLITLYEEAGKYDRALDYARRALAADPLVEEVHGDLIRVLARSGQPAASLRQYRELEKLLADNLGETPSAEIRTLVAGIREDAERGTFAVAPTSRTSSPITPKMPAPLTRFFGRTEEIAQARHIIQTGQARLLTLIGPGGCGKTRLSIEIIAGLTGGYNGAVWFVPLADLHEARFIPHAISDTVRPPASSSLSPQEQVIEWLTWRPALLVLDNLEHLIDGAAPLLRELLERCPELTIITTSRQRLGVEGEVELTVLPLPVPTTLFISEPLDSESYREGLLEWESVQLFLDRARAVRPSFQIDEQNARAIAQLCERLEGIPLAMELCAAWAQTLTPAQMLEQLDRPFDLLVSRRREVAPRHRSLHAAIEYSYEQLSPVLQQFFKRLSVFRNGWTLEAAEAVCLEPDTGAAFQRKTQTLDLLTELRERSLITVEEVGPEMRYRMLETLREFAAEQEELAPEPELRRRHVLFYLHVMEEAERLLTGPEQSSLLIRLGAEHDNLRAALAWTVEEQESTIGLRLAGAMTAFWDARGFLGEGQQWLAQVLSLPPDERLSSREARLLRAKALTARGHLARNQGYLPEIDAAMEEAVRLWRACADERGMALALLIRATIAYSREEGEIARKYLQEGLLLSRQLQDRALIGRALHNLGNIALSDQEWSQAAGYYTEGIGLYRAEGNRHRVGQLLNNLGLVSLYQGDYQTALTILHEALETGRELSDRSGMALASLNLATTYRMEGHFTSAQSFIEEAARYALDAGERRLLPWCARERGHLCCAQGDYVRGIRLLAAAETQRMAIGISFKPADPEELERSVALARNALGEAAFAAAWSVGSSMPRARVFAEALHLPETDPWDQIWAVASTTPKE